MSPAPRWSSATRRTSTPRSASRTPWRRTRRCSPASATAARRLGSNGVYGVKAFNYGLILPAPGEMGEIGTRWDIAPLTALPAPLPPAIRPLPPTSQWVNVRTLGVKGDDKTDDTAAIQHAIDTTGALFPQRPLHRARHDPAEARHGADRPASVHHPVRPARQHARLCRRRRAQGAAGDAARAATISSRASASSPAASIRARWRRCGRRARNSLMDDVRFLGGHGTNNPDGSRCDPYNATHSADPDMRKRWDGQYPTLWVTNGGGGTFANLWTPNTYAQSGFSVSDTKTPGHVYEISSEHHVRTEFRSGAPRTGSSTRRRPRRKPARARRRSRWRSSNSSNIIIANYHAYRVTRTLQPVDTAARIYQFQRHPFPQRACECRERAWHLRRQWLRHLSCAPANSPPRTRSAT